MTGFNSPNHTQTPNDLFDKYMAVMGNAELRVVLVAIRKTFGFHKSSDAISFTQFMKMSGLSRQSVADGLAAALKRGILKELPERGKRGLKSYELVVLVDQSTDATSLPSRPDTSLPSRPDKPATGKPSRPTKEKDSKEKEKKVTPPNGDALAVGAIIKAWLDTNNAISPKAYSRTDYRDYANAMHKAGITPEDVTNYILKEKQGKFYAQKAVPFSVIAENIKTFKTHQRPAPAASDEPTPEQVAAMPDMTPDDLAILDKLSDKFSGKVPA